MLKETIQTTLVHFNRAKDNVEDIKKFPVNITIYEDKEKIKTIDAFIFRFIKLQDFMGDRLFKDILKIVGEYKDNMSLIDILDKLEKLEIIKDADHWINYRAIRNKLTHEYPDNQEEVIEGINLAIIYFEEISQVLNNIMNYIEEKKLA